MQMTKQEQLAKAERDLEGILSRLFSEEWADWNSPFISNYSPTSSTKSAKSESEYCSKGLERRAISLSAKLSHT
jgi:hypothetical protein